MCSWAALERDPALAAPYAHVVALDPPLGHEAALRLAGAHGALVHLAWGEGERRFALKVLEATGDLRAPARALYRALKAGTALPAALAATGPPAVAGRALRVLTELGLVTVDRATPAVAVPAAERTDLEHSPSFRAAAARLQATRARLDERRARAAPSPARETAAAAA